MIIQATQDHIDRASKYKGHDICQNCILALAIQDSTEYKKAVVSSGSEDWIRVTRNYADFGLLGKITGTHTFKAFMDPHNKSKSLKPFTFEFELVERG